MRGDINPNGANKEQEEIAGKWDVGRATHGFLINTTDGTICVPQERVLGARNMVLPDTCAPGYARVTLRDVQVLRGLFRHWLVANWFWEISLQAIDVLLAHAGEASSYFNCVDADIWTSFWAMLEVLRVTAAHEARWGSFPKGGWGAFWR